MSSSPVDEEDAGHRRQDPSNRGDRDRDIRRRLLVAALVEASLRGSVVEAFARCERVDAEADGEAGSHGGCGGCADEHQRRPAVGTFAR